MLSSGILVVPAAAAAAAAIAVAVALLSHIASCCHHEIDDDFDGGSVLLVALNSRGGLQQRCSPVWCNMYYSSRLNSSNVGILGFNVCVGVYVMDIIESQSFVAYCRLLCSSTE